MRLPSRRSLLLLGVAIAAIAWLLMANRPSIEPGLRADIDPAPFRDTARDAVAPAQVIRPAAGGSTAGRPPNIVVILADDLGYGDLASYGSRAIRTPNLDRLAAEGVRFTSFYASASVCSPSRAGLMTGRYPVRTGISYVIFASEISLDHRLNLTMARLGSRLGTSRFHDSYVSGLPDSEITLAEALKVAGYATGMVGKWHLGDFSHDQRFLPTRHGFDFFEGIPHSNDEFPVALWRNDRELTPNIGLAQEPMTGDFTRAAVGFIEEHRDQPFFLYFAHKDVHLPFFPSERFAGKSAAGRYGDAAEELDWSVGEVLRALEERGLREDTLVIFTSDNGAWFEGSTQGLRGRKGMPFEGGQRVPMIVSWPRRLPAGTTVEAPAMNIDVFPTVLRLAGLDLPSDRIIDGRDLWGVMSGENPAAPHETLLFFDDKVIGGARADRWKYYRHVDRYYWPVPLDRPDTFAGRRAAGYKYSDPQTGRETRLVADDPMLYDLQLDPAESYNVADRHPEVVESVRTYVERWEQDFFANPRGWK
jgi:arylsulfatase A-like enzyme